MKFMLFNYIAHLQIIKIILLKHNPPYLSRSASNCSLFFLKLSNDFKSLFLLVSVSSHNYKVDITFMLTLSFVLIWDTSKSCLISSCFMQFSRVSTWNSWSLVFIQDSEKNWCNVSTSSTNDIIFKSFLKL